MPRVNASVVCAPPAPHGECFSVKFQHDMSMLAAGYADGSVSRRLAYLLAGWLAWPEWPGLCGRGGRLPDLAALFCRCLLVWRSTTGWRERARPPCMHTVNLPGLAV
eukprot:COSAG02_NODE_2575_length_8498_cov_9.569473_9_plen_107_part_00